jgi:hypothetical protein
VIPVGAELIRLYADYLHGEYGDIDSDYVFINLFAGPRGQAWSYPAAYDLVTRLRTKTGFDFDPHWFRHSMATRFSRRRPGRGRLEAAGPLVGDRHAGRLRSPDRCGRPRGAGEGGLAHRAGGDLVTAAVVITNADRAQWQRQAAAGLCRIPGDCAGLPPIAWTVGPGGCLLAGRINGLAPSARVRAAFTAWRAARALEERRERPGGGGTVHLHAAARRGGVKVRVTATVFEAGECR